MDMHIIEAEFKPDRGTLLARMGLEVDSDEGEDFLALLEQVMPLAKPKTAVGSVGVEALDEDFGRVVLGGVEFTSTLLARNLKGVDTVWPAFATCGRELYDFAMAMPDPFERFWVEEIMQQALHDVRLVMEEYLAAAHYAGKKAYMGPGSLKEWPIGQQRPLFRLFGGAADRCGVTLTDSLLMLPNKTVSRIYFPNESGYINCSLCPKEKCPNRRAKFDPELAAAAM